MGKFLQCDGAGTGSRLTFTFCNQSTSDRFKPSVLTDVLQEEKSFDKVQYSHLWVMLLQAAGRHQCSYLISLQKQEFLLQGGDHTWLKGLSRIPQKLRDLYEINKILAHRPWLLTKSHIEVKTVHPALEE